MKKYFFTRESLLAIGIFMFSFTHIWAQNGVKDSLYKELPKPVLDEVYQLKFKEVLVPVMGIGTAALFVCDGWFTEQRENVQDLLSAKGRNKIKFILHKLLGLAGLPIFSEGGGLWYVFKPSFGYIIGFAVAAYVNGKIANAKTHPSYRRLLGANFLGLFIVYAFGMIYYYVISNFYLNSPIGVGALFLYCFVLAVPGDIVLCIVAAIIGKRMIPLIQGGRLG